jgi:hypothetical protein
MMFQYLPWLILGYFTYIAYTYRNRIWCTFRRYDKSKAGKWANARNKDGTWGDVEFDGGLYHVEPARTVIGWRMLLGFLPFPVRESDYVQGSARALDPSTFSNTFSAEERKQLDRTDDLKGLMVANKESVQQGSKMKQGLLQQYMPFIMIAGFAIVGYLVFQMQHRMDMLGAATNLIEAQLAKILANLP